MAQPDRLDLETERLRFLTLSSSYAHIRDAVIAQATPSAPQRRIQRNFHSWELPAGPRFQADNIRHADAYGAKLALKRSRATLRQACRTIGRSGSSPRLAAATRR